MNTAVMTPQSPDLNFEVSEQRTRWNDLVRTACYTVSLHSPALITATTVSASSEGLSAVQRHDLLSLASDVAGQQGLCAEVEDDGSRLVARFSRLAPLRVLTPDDDEAVAQAPREEGAGTPQPAGSFLNHLRRFVSHGRAGDKA